MSDDLKSGLDMMKLAAAFVGTILSLSFWPPDTRKAAWVRVGTGFCLSIVTVPPLFDVILWQFPTFPDSYGMRIFAYMMAGLFAFIIIPVIGNLIRGWKPSGGGDA
jgi:Na+/proline symporter